MAKLRIRQLRKERGVTIAELADAVGVSAPHLSEVERGIKNLNTPLMDRIARALSVSITDLFWRSAFEDFRVMQDRWIPLIKIIENFSDDELDHLTRIAKTFESAKFKLKREV